MRGCVICAWHVCKTDVYRANSVDKTLMEKISLIDSLDKKEKAAFFTMLDALVAKKKLKDNLSNVLQLAQ